jgi:hypothetical protein
MKIKNLLLIGVILLIFNACKKDKEIIVPIPEAVVQYRSTDSMKLDSQALFFNLLEPALYSQVNNKQDIVSSANGEMRFYNEPNNKFSIDLTEKSNPQQETNLNISFDNKNINNISGTYPMASNGICVKWSQNLEKSYAQIYLLCEQIIDGNITIQYDAATNTISGKIEKLKYLFSVYLPLYVNGYIPPSVLASVLTSSFSNRNQDIVFKYVKQR